MTDLTHLLRERIIRDGPLTVADYMSAALGDPRYGYYMTRDPFGRPGDFITAPEVSQMFGELLGLWAAAVWQGMGQPPSVCLVELGPGRGTLMADALRAIGQTVPGFLEALDVALVEMSPVLQARQKETLRSWQENVAVTWHDSLGTIAEVPSIVIANEFFDALPIRQYERRDGTWRERLIGIDQGGGFCFVLSDSPADVSMIPARLRNEPGGIFETCPDGTAIIEDLCRRFAVHGGAGLMIDYGHGVQGLGDTLQAVKNHQYQAALDTPGEADLTAHVDFEALAAAVKSQGARSSGPLTQGVFLERLGISQRAESLMAKAAPDQRGIIESALERLIGEDEMGTLFKVLAVADSGSAPLPGFD